MSLDKVKIIDEGLLQRILSLYEREFNKAEAGSIVRLVSCADITVCSMGGDFARFSVAQDKVDSPRYKMGQVYYMKWVDVFRHNYMIIKSVGMEEKQTRVFVSLDLANNKEESINKLKQLVCDKITP